MKKVNRVGKRYGRLVVVEEKGKNKNGIYVWLCKCDCGNNKVVSGASLQSKKTKSCGCLDAESRKKPKNITHGMYKSKVYSEWASMKSRCSSYYHNHQNYYDRGIKVCKEWENDFNAFFDCVSKLEHYGQEGYSLDRINNDGNYEPNNVRWATNKQQQNNRTNNIYIEYKDKTQTLKQWSEELGLDYGMLKTRYRRGWTTPKLFIQPLK